MPLSPPPEDSTARSLWARLLAGHVTEVYVLSYRGLYRDLPQTLGLEVISYEAHLYDSGSRSGQRHQRGVRFCRTPSQGEFHKVSAA